MAELCRRGRDFRGLQFLRPAVHAKSSSELLKELSYFERVVPTEFKVVKTTDESRKVAAVVSWTAMSSGRKNLTPPNLSEAQLCLQMAADYFPIAC